MTQSHSQIKLTSKPINLDDVISFVNGNNRTISSYSGFSKKNYQPNTPAAIEAQATLAQMELDKILTHTIENFAIIKLAIHFRLGSTEDDEVAIAFSIACQKASECALASNFLMTELKETSHSWKQEITSNGDIWVKSV